MSVWTDPTDAELDAIEHEVDVPLYGIVEEDTAPRILAIDPGNEMSAYAIIDAETRRPITFGKSANEGLRMALPGFSGVCGRVAIEMVASYGMAVGREVFETCVWIGRFVERSRVPAELIYRRDIKLHHCGSAKAKDSNITQALIDRFAHGQPNKGKGTIAQPGWFHGFAGDVWQAYALAVYVADMIAADSLPRSPGRDGSVSPRPGKLEGGQ